MEATKTTPTKPATPQDELPPEPTQSVYIADKDQVVNYPVGMSNEEINFAIHTEVRGKSPESYYEGFKPIRIVYDHFKTMAGMNPDGVQIKTPLQNVQENLSDGLKAIKKVLEVEDKFVDNKMKEVMVRANRPYEEKLTAELSFDELKKTYGSWNDVWEGSVGEDILTTGARKAQTFLTAGMLPYRPERNTAEFYAYGSKLETFIPYLIADEMPTAVFEIASKPIEAATLMAATSAAMKHIATPVAHKIMTMLPEKWRANLLYDMAKTELSLTEEYATLGFKPNVKTSVLKARWENMVRENRMAGGSLNDLHPQAQAFKKIMRSRDLFMGRFVDFLRTDAGQEIFKSATTPKAPLKLLTSERGAAYIPKKGDLVQAAGKIGQVARVTGGKIALVDVQGKLVQFLTEELKPLQERGGGGVGQLGSGEIKTPSSSTLKKSQGLPSSVQAPSTSSKSVASGASSATEKMRSPNSESENRKNFLSEFSMSLPSQSELNTFYGAVQGQLPAFEEQVKNIASEIGAEGWVYRVKRESSLFKKLKRKQISNPDRSIGSVGDMIGSSIIVPEGTVDTAMNLLAAKYPNYKLSSNFREQPTFLGYQGIHYDVELPNGMMVENQLFEGKTELARKLWAHKIYDHWREYIERNDGTVNEIKDIFQKVKAAGKSKPFDNAVKISKEIYGGLRPVHKKYYDMADAALAGRADELLDRGARYVSKLKNEVFRGSEGALQRGMISTEVPGQALQSILKKGGVTINPITKVEPTEGWAFSAQKNTEMVLPAEATEQEIKENISKFINTNMTSLVQSGNYLGGWKAADGKIYLDVSRVVPEADQAGALTVANDAQQLAIYNLRTGQEVPTEYGKQQSNASLGSDQTRDVSAGSGGSGGQDGGGTGGGPPAEPPAGSSPEEPTAVNVNRLKIADEAKGAIANATKALGKEIENQSGVPLTHDEVIEKAKEADVLSRGVSRQATLEFQASLLKTRQHLAALAEQNELTQEFLDTLKVMADHGTDIARNLESFKIEAIPEFAGTKIKIIRDLIKLGNTTDDILKAAQGVDFKDEQAVAKFYRQFVKPTLPEILDEFVYMNILSSPLTHIVNAFSNAIQLAGLNPATKLASGAIDAVASNLFGAERKHYLSEVPAFYKGVLNSVGDAFQAAVQAMGGKKNLERPDVKHLPTLSKFVDYATLGVGKYVTRALEASDIFFRTMIEAGEVEALSGKLGPNPTPAQIEAIQKEARKRADYYVFRSKPDTTNATGQGKLLSAIDEMTSAVYKLRSVPGFKWFIRFVQTPMNILKQGIEYSPAGGATLFGAEDKAEQAGKAMIGSMVFAAGAWLAANNKTTWAAPTSNKEKSEFYEAGLQPYSVRIGDQWVSYSKLGPLSYPLAMASALHYFTKESPNALSDSEMDKVVDAMTGIMRFFSDQSYMQGLGDLVGFARGEKTKAFTSVPTQLIPLSSLQGWVNSIMDPLKRKAESGLSIESVIDQIQMKIAGMSQFVPPQMTSEGLPVKNEDRLTKAVSPVKTSKVKPGPYREYQENQQTKREINKMRKEL